MRIRTLVPSIVLVVLAGTACTTAEKAAGAPGSLSEPQKAKRFARIVANYYDNYLSVELDALRRYVYRQSTTCDLSVPESATGYEDQLQEAVAGLLTDVRLIQPYGEMRARLAALHPRAAALRTLVSSSGILLREASKLSSLPDPDYCPLVHAWQDQQWSHSYPATYYYGVMRERGVNGALMSQARSRAWATSRRLQKLGLSDHAAVALAVGVGSGLLY